MPCGKWYWITRSKCATVERMFASRVPQWQEMDKVARQLGRLFNLPRSYSSERALPQLSRQFNSAGGEGEREKGRGHNIITTPKGGGGKGDRTLPATFQHKPAASCDVHLWLSQNSHSARARDNFSSLTSLSYFYFTSSLSFLYHPLVPFAENEVLVMRNAHSICMPTADAATKSCGNCLQVRAYI